VKRVGCQYRMIDRVSHTTGAAVPILTRETPATMTANGTNECITMQSVQ
jgi:hypothetical protein